MFCVNCMMLMWKGGRQLIIIIIIVIRIIFIMMMMMMMMMMLQLALSGHIAGERELGCPQTPAWVLHCSQCPQCQDIVEDIVGLAANYNTTPPTPWLDPAPAAIKLQRCAPLICQNLSGQKYKRKFKTEMQKKTGATNTWTRLLVGWPWPASFLALSAAELDFLKILAKISCLISQIPV